MEQTPTFLTIGLLSTCVDAKYIEQVKAVSETWGSSLPQNIKLYYFGGSAPCPLNLPNYINIPGVAEDYHSAFAKQFLGLSILLKKSPSKFYLIGGTDNYIVIDRLVSLLSNYSSSSDDLYLGGSGSYRNFISTFDLSGKEEIKNIYYHSGGASFVLSHTTAVKICKYSLEIIKMWPSLCKLSRSDYLVDACDFAVGYLCSNLNIEPTISPYFYANNYLGLDNKKERKCDNTTISNLITCHYMTPDDIRAFHSIYTSLNGKEGWTFVTSFLTEKKEVVDKDILSLNVQMIIFADESSYLKIWQIRKPFLNKTYFQVIKFENLPFAARIPDIAKTFNLGGHTPTYFALSASKYTFLEMGISDNPFNSSHFAWIDSNFTFPTLVEEIPKINRDALSYCMIQHVSNGEVLNKKEFYKRDSKSISTNFFTARIDYMGLIIDKFNHYFHSLIDEGCGHTEEQIISVMQVENPEWFEFYYDSILNYSKIRDNVHGIFYRIVRSSRMNSSYNTTLKSANALLDSEIFSEGKCEEMKLQILTEMFIAAWWLKNFSLAVEVMGKMMLLNVNPTPEIIRTTDYLHLISSKPRVELEEKPDVYLEDKHYFIYGNFEITTKSYFLANPCYRPLSLRLQ